MLKIDQTVSPYTRTITTDADPAKNGFTLGPHADPVPPGAGEDPRSTADSIMAVLRSTAAPRIFGWRENAIDRVDRVSPALYDNLVLKRRVRAKA